MTASPEELLGRLEARDTTLWPAGNTASDRLGWLDAPRQIDRERKDLRSWAGSIDQETVVVLGVGGSALAPAVLGALGRSFGEASERNLVVCFSTDPSTVEALPLEEAFIVVTSKTGRTRETDALYAYARTRQRDPRRFAVISDPGTPLVRRAQAERVMRVFENRPDVAGPYAALSYEGAVPAALLGYDLEELVGRALEIDRLESVAAGIAVADAASEGRTTLTLEADERIRPLASWVEHLVAASLAKNGRGIVPVPTTQPEPGPDRIERELVLESAHTVGATIFGFEIETVIAAHLLGVDPFSQPDTVQAAELADDLLADLPLAPAETDAADRLWSYLDDELRPGDYVSLEAYLPADGACRLETLRQKVRDVHGGIAVTAGFGPNILHTTGQLHEGGPNTVIVVQLLPRSPRTVLAVPEAGYDFGTLTDADAEASARSLAQRGRRVVRIAVDDPVELL